MGKLIGITFDCENAERAALFWAAALDGYMVDASGDRLHSESGPEIYFQTVPEPRTAKTRVHLDIVSNDVKGDLFRLQRMGAKMVGEMEEGGHKWAVLQDIEGNEFCVVHGETA